MTLTEEERQQLIEKIKQNVTVLPNGCWKWNLSCDWRGDGYPQMRFRNSTVRVHRFLYMLVKDKLDLPAHIQVCHSCDYTRCVNPNCMFEGTNAENHADSARKGRRHKGYKLTEDDVAMIRAWPGTQQEIAEDYGISQSTVSMIRSGKLWPSRES